MDILKILFLLELFTGCDRVNVLDVLYCMYWMACDNERGVLRRVWLEICKETYLKG